MNKTDDVWIEEQIGRLFRGLSPCDQEDLEKRVIARLERELRKTKMRRIEGGGKRSAAITERGPQSDFPLFLDRASAKGET